jgi:hypothetical protein
MSKFESVGSNRQPPRKREIHPIWRGVGFAMIILIPLLSYIGTLIIIEENAKQGWFAIPRDLISKYIEPYLYVKIILTIVLIFVFSSIFLFITGLINRILAPPRYGVYDVPPQSFRGKKKSR